MVSSEQIEQYQTQGYFIADDAVEPDMLAPLLEAARRVKAKVRSGEVNVSTHWAAPGEPWAIRGLLSPEFGESVFAEYLASRPVMGYVESFLGSEVRKDVILFTNPHHADFDTGWHRDVGTDRERDRTEAEELEMLNRPMTYLKWHLALLDESCLVVVPGSHRRYRTEYEQVCMLASSAYRQYLSKKDDPRQPVAAPNHTDIPGQKVIELRAGQTVFWTGDMIHRGGPKKDEERLTLSGRAWLPEEGKGIRGTGKSEP